MGVAEKTTGAGVGVDDVQLFSRIETVLLDSFATARSSLASPLRSPIATEYGVVPVPKSVFPPKLPVPVPIRIERVLLSMAMASSI